MRRLPPPPVPGTRKKRAPRKGRAFPAPERSARLYVYVDASQVHLFRYFLEARDNLGIMTVVDRWRAALLIRYAPQQAGEMREFLEELRQTLPFAGPFHFPDEKAF